MTLTTEGGRDWADIREAEDVRQRALTRSLGQVQCIGSHETWRMDDVPCSWCGAQV